MRWERDGFLGGIVLIPLRHENMKGRRWPVVTFTLIGLNILVFLLTLAPMTEEQAQQGPTRVHLILLAAMHPELQPSPEAAAFIASVKKNTGTGWEELTSPNRAVHDSWDANIRKVDDTAELQHEMDSLSQEFENYEQNSVLEKYAFVPAHPRAISYITANFLHGGWLHIIGNLWFLWLAGFILEDTWGRVIYSGFYLVAGAVALQFYAWCAPGSFTPLVGASGAVAALMGAFLVRFPKMKIEMYRFGFIWRGRFKMSAYWLLPLWLVAEFFLGAALGQSSSVAHWAHVGGFLFGMLGAFAIKQFGLEQKANEAIESKLTWTGDEDIVRASEAIEQNNMEQAAVILQKHLASKAASADALNLLQQVQWRRNDMPAYLQASVQLCQFHLKAQDSEAAWRVFEEYTSAGGNNMPASTWLEIARSLEAQHNFDRAVSEYERLAETYPNEKQSILALLAAGRLSLKKLGRPEDAFHYFKLAETSKMPHLDWEANIQAGIEEAQRAMQTIQMGTAK
jgi:membrane associated rhomboid family serine protease